MADINDRRLSKTISHALRHAPWLYELELDEEGWTPISDLLDGLRRHRPAWNELSREDLQAMMRRPGKKRFEIRDGKIRALYGHSIEMKIHKEPVVPPTHLFHGTAPDNAERILGQGLKPMNRQYAHLSSDVESAREVGRRKSRQPVLLVIEAGAAHKDGVRFYHGNQMVWLADRVPPRYISRRESGKGR